MGNQVDWNNEMAYPLIFSAPLVSCSKSLDRQTESKRGLRPSFMIVFFRLAVRVFFLISCYGNSVDWTNEIAYSLIALSSTGFL